MNMYKQEGSFGTRSFLGLFVLFLDLYSKQAVSACSYKVKMGIIKTLHLVKCNTETTGYHLTKT